MSSYSYIIPDFNFSGMKLWFQPTACGYLIPTVTVSVKYQLNFQWLKKWFVSPGFDSRISVCFVCLSRRHWFSEIRLKHLDPVNGWTSLGFMMARLSHLQWQNLVMLNAPFVQIALMNSRQNSPSFSSLNCVYYEDIFSRNVQMLYNWSSCSPECSFLSFSWTTCSIFTQ